MADENDVYQKDIRKSKFVQITDSESSDTFDLVRNGQNLKIAQTDLINSLGFTGSIEAKGEVEAIPVLDVQGSINYIRGILGGSGILASLSPGDAVEVAHNFIADSEGVAVLINATADQPTIRSITAGTGITVGGAGGTIQIAASEEPPTSTKTIQVFTIDDFPTAVGGVITLEDETHYLVQNDISSANRYVMGANTVLSGSDSAMITLEYTGASTMITGVDVDTKVRDITLSAPSGKGLDISSSGNDNQFSLKNVNLYAVDGADFDNILAMIFDTVFIVCTGYGLAFTGNFQTALFNIVALVIPSGTGNGIDLGTATFDTFQIVNGFGTIDSTGYVLTGAADSGNINAGGLGAIQLSRQYGSATPLNNISPFDDLWEMVHNASIPNSVNLALATHGGATIDIVTQSVPVIIGPTWTDETMYRFTHDANGRWTYTGKGAQISLNCSITGARAASGTDNYGFYFYVNGVQVTETLVTREFTNANGNVSMFWSLFLTTDDYVEIFVENQDGTIDFDVATATLKAD